MTKSFDLDKFGSIEIYSFGKFDCLKDFVKTNSLIEYDYKTDQNFLNFQLSTSQSSTTLTTTTTTTTTSAAFKYNTRSRYQQTSISSCSSNSNDSLSCSKQQQQQQQISNNDLSDFMNKLDDNSAFILDESVSEDSSDLIKVKAPVVISSNSTSSITTRRRTAARFAQLLPECGKIYCRLGCICEQNKFDSSQAKKKPKSPKHCGRFDCMLECNCARRLRSSTRKTQESSNESNTTNNKNKNKDSKSSKTTRSSNDSLRDSSASSSSSSSGDSIRSSTGSSTSNVVKLRKSKRVKHKINDYYYYYTKQGSITTTGQNENSSKRLIKKKIKSLNNNNNNNKKSISSEPFKPYTQSILLQLQKSDDDQDEALGSKSNDKIPLKLEIFTSKWKSNLQLSTKVLRLIAKLIKQLELLSSSNKHWKEIEFDYEQELNIKLYSSKIKHKPDYMQRLRPICVRISKFKKKDNQNHQQEQQEQFKFYDKINELMKSNSSNLKLNLIANERVNLPLRENQNESNKTDEKHVDYNNNQKIKPSIKTIDQENLKIVDKQSDKQESPAQIHLEQNDLNINTSKSSSVVIKQQGPIQKTLPRLLCRKRTTSTNLNQHQTSSPDLNNIFKSLDSLFEKKIQKNQFNDISKHILTFRPVKLDINSNEFKSLFDDEKEYLKKSALTTGKYELYDPFKNESLILNAYKSVNSREIVDSVCDTLNDMIGVVCTYKQNLDRKTQKIDIDEFLPSVSKEINQQPIHQTFTKPNLLKRKTNIIILNKQGNNNNNLNKTPQPFNTEKLNSNLFKQLMPNISSSILTQNTTGKTFVKVLNNNSPTPVKGLMPISIVSNTGTVVNNTKIIHHPVTTSLQSNLTPINSLTHHKNIINSFVPIRPKLLNQSNMTQNLLVSSNVNLTTTTSANISPIYKVSFTQNQTINKVDSIGFKLPILSSTLLSNNNTTEQAGMSKIQNENNLNNTSNLTNASIIANDNPSNKKRKRKQDLSNLSSKLLMIDDCSIISPQLLTQSNENKISKVSINQPVNTTKRTNITSSSSSSLSHPLLISSSLFKSSKYKQNLEKEKKKSFDQSPVKLNKKSDLNEDFNNELNFSHEIMPDENFVISPCDEKSIDNSNDLGFRTCTDQLLSKKNTLIKIKKEPDAASSSSFSIIELSSSTESCSSFSDNNKVQLKRKKLNSFSTNDSEQKFKNTFDESDCDLDDSELFNEEELDEKDTSYQTIETNHNANNHNENANDNENFEILLNAALLRAAAINNDNNQTNLQTSKTEQSDSNQKFSLKNSKTSFNNSLINNDKKVISRKYSRKLSSCSNNSSNLYDNYYNDGNNNNNNNNNLVNNSCFNINLNKKYKLATSLNENEESALTSESSSSDEDELELDTFNDNDNDNDDDILLSSSRSTSSNSNSIKSNKNGTSDYNFNNQNSKKPISLTLHSIRERQRRLRLKNLLTKLKLTIYNLRDDSNSITNQMKNTGDGFNSDSLNVSSCTNIISDNNKTQNLKHSKQAVLAEAVDYIKSLENQSEILSNEFKRQYEKYVHLQKKLENFK